MGISCRFATPCLDHRVTLEYLMSALKTSKLLLENGIAYEWANRPGDPFIAKCRSNLVCDFLNGNAENLFFLDDDIGWPAEKALEFIKRPEPVLVGVYPQKLEELSFPCSFEADGPNLVEKDGLYKAVLAPTGFMRIKRWVLEKLYANTDLSTPYSEKDADGVTYQRRAIFNSGPSSDGQWWGEDYAFCNACRAEGIDIWIDPDIPFYHRGQKRYEARLSHSLDVYHERARMNEALKGMPVPPDLDRPEDWTTQDALAMEGLMLA